VRGGKSGRAAADSRQKERTDRNDLQRQRLLDKYADIEPDGLILCMYGSHADAVFADGKVRFCLLTPKVHKLFGLCVGDRVYTKRGATDDERIVVARDLRRTELRRKRGEEDRTGHVIAANVDQLAITASLREPPLRTGAIDRYLLLASVLNLEPIIVLTKMDMCPAEDPGWEVLIPYSELEIPLLPTSAVTGEGIEELLESLEGKVTAFAGHSGVGKSALCQALGLDGAMEVGDLSRSSGRVRGRHTTSVARLLPLPGSGFVVDTPGVRAIGLVDVKRHDVGVHFPEFAEYAAKCQFADCLHAEEEGCAVWAAASEEDISPERFDSYLRLIESIDD